MATKTTRPGTASLEVKTYVNEKGRHIMLLSCHLVVVKELTLDFLPSYKDIQEKIIKGNFSPIKENDHAMQKVGDYIRIVLNVSPAAEYKDPNDIRVLVNEVFSTFPREQLCDYLLNEGWELLAMTLGPKGEVVEKWAKKNQSGEGDDTNKQDDDGMPPKRKVLKKE